MATYNGIPENGHKAGQACVICDHRRTDGQTGMWCLHHKTATVSLEREGNSDVGYNTCMNHLQEADS